ncbi:hypothetical protein NF27_AP00050 [Candidatus Jidaibacter acanthamoeba]|uniref:Uncharacterized protein n=1 Tax=Candidatus Jidaibacter acanthamoebae TaxID=86105 RepID=A0A0C1MVJ5_9RICK|nr:hypothetical protein NF27_AP00050 [Candidatus Jidaibacter acanthamoeba]
MKSNELQRLEEYKTHLLKIKRLESLYNNL